MNNFSNVKTLKLGLVHLEHIIMADKRKTTKPYALGNTLFSNLYRVDLQAIYTLGRRAGVCNLSSMLPDDPRMWSQVERHGR